MPSKYVKKLKHPCCPDVPAQDWPAILHHLRFKVGYSMAGLARACHCARETLYSIELGMEPRWTTGTCLLKLFQESS